MRFHDDPSDGSHWCLECVSRANEKRAAECLGALKETLWLVNQVNSGFVDGKDYNLIVARAESALAKDSQGTL
jgi:hypothetical protein